MSAPASLPIDDSHRVARLRALAVLDSEREPVFDALAEAAALACGAPMAAIALVDAERQWFKAAIGLGGIVSTPRDLAFCSHAILGFDLMEVPDTTLDPRFDDHPYVTGTPAIRFYGGVPIVLSDGHTIGTVCVMDHVPRTLGDAQRAILRQLAIVAAGAFEAREATMRSLAHASRAEAEISELYRATPAALFSMDGEGRLRIVSDQWLAETGYDRDEVLGRRVFDFLTDASRARALDVGFPTFLKTGRAREHAYQVVRKDGTTIDVVVSQVLQRDASGRPVRTMSVFENVTARRIAEDALHASQRFLQRTGEVAGVGGWTLELDSCAMEWSGETCRLHDVAPGHRPTFAEAVGYCAPEAREALNRGIHDAIASHAPFDLQAPFVSATGRPFWARIVGSIEYVDGQPVRVVGAVQDVTRTKAIEDDLAKSRELLQVTLDSIADGVVTADVDGRVQWLNPVAERLTGWPKGEAVGRPLHEVFVAVDAATGERGGTLPCPDVGGTIAPRRQSTLTSRTGTACAIEDTASPIRDADGEIHGAVLVFRDVSEQRRMHDEMAHRASHDLLTGLVNRSEFETRLARRIAEPDGASQSLLYIDLDRFKLVNDACGHAAGDRLLRQVSGILERCARPGDTVARLGGDEFGIVLARCDADCAQRVAQSICDRMTDFRFDHDGHRFQVGASIGLVPVDDRWTNVNALLQAADASCYAAKDDGRNRVHAWSDSDPAVRARHGDLRWVHRLETALDEDRFVLFGQRIDSIGGATGGLHVEVLLRMRERDGALVMPGAFLAAAERFHLATRIDRWVVSRAFEAMGAAMARGVDIDLMAINLSGQSLGDREFHRDTMRKLRDAAFDVRKLCFEITETTAITQLDCARRFIDDLHAVGVRVALDDFGAGASSFGYLEQLPVDFLKIDGQFIRRLLDDALSDAAVRCFRDVARIVGVRTIAEFVESADVHDALGRIGIDMAQGYLVHRPEPLADLLYGVTVPYAAAA